MHTRQYSGYGVLEMDENGQMHGSNPSGTFIADDGQAYVNKSKAAGKTISKAVFEISDASAEKAINFQKSQLGKQLGTYYIRTRSCLTHVMEVLAAADVDVSKSPMKQYHFIQKKIGAAKCR